MSPISKRTGRKYAKGSHTTMGAFPRVCHAGGRCLHGGKIVGSGPYPLWFETVVVSGELRSWHHACKLAALREGV